jgi:hypothetical protein
MVSIRQLQTSVASSRVISGELMSSTKMGRPTYPVAMREHVRDEVTAALGMILAAEDLAPLALSTVCATIQMVGTAGRMGEATALSSKDEALQDRALRTVAVPLRLEWFDGRTRTIQIVVTDLDDRTEELRLDGHTIGFISRAGPIFVALTGTRLDRAEECGQCLLWDNAATILVTLMSDLPEPEKPDPLVEVPQHKTAYSYRQLLRLRELSRSGV